MIAGHRSVYLFDFGEKSVEVLVFGTVVFSQAGLHQTPEAKSVVNTHYTATMRALVGLVLRCSKRISNAVEIHFSSSRLAATRQGGLSPRRSLSADTRLCSRVEPAASAKRTVGEAYM